MYRSYIMLGQPQHKADCWGGYGCGMGVVDERIFFTVNCVHYTVAVLSCKAAVQLDFIMKLTVLDSDASLLFCAMKAVD